MLKLNEKSAKSTYIILALSIIMLVIVGIRLYSDTYAAFMQKDIASQIIRFHIRANDDSEEQDRIIKCLLRQRCLII